MQKPTSLPKITGFEAIALEVGDFGRSVQFYADVLRLEVEVLAPGHFAQVTGMSLYLLATGKKPVSKGFHIELMVDDVEAWYTYLVERGITPLSEPKDMPWGSRNFSLRDPDGHEIELSGAGRAAA